jgi:hypothetical protein
LSQIRKDYARLKTAKNYEIKNLQAKVEECNKQIKFLKEGKYDKFINLELQKKFEEEISFLRKDNGIKLAKSE